MDQGVRDILDLSQHEYKGGFQIASECDRLCVYMEANVFSHKISQISFYGFPTWQLFGHSTHVITGLNLTGGQDCLEGISLPYSPTKSHINNIFSSITRASVALCASSSKRNLQLYAFDNTAKKNQARVQRQIGVMYSSEWPFRESTTVSISSYQRFLSLRGYKYSSHKIGNHFVPIHDK